MNVFTDEDKLTILSDLVSIKSVNDNEREVADYIKQLFQKYEIDAEMIEVEGDRVNLVAEIGQGKPVLGVSGHMDVVAATNEADWTHPPFELTEDEGKLYGRGSADMKSGLAALVIAMIEIKEQDLLKNGTVRLIATTGEESGQKGSAKIYKDGYMEDVKALVIPEPSEDVAIRSHKGSMNVSVKSVGKSSHSSAPFLGINAIDQLTPLMEEVKAEVRQLNEETEFTSFDFSNTLDTYSESASGSITKEEISKILSGVVINNTIISGGDQPNSIPDQAEVQFNIRTVPEVSNQQIKDIFEKVVSKYNDDQQGQLDYEFFLDLGPVAASKENDLLELIRTLGEKYLDRDIQSTASIGVTDASNLLKGKDSSFPLAMFGPGQTTLAHQVDEYVDKDIYFKFIDLFVELFPEYTNR